jgi:phosphopantothenoylcysteine synthetase/decarboxylase
VRMMIARDWAVRVIMTASATRFVGTLTFRTLSRNPVAVDMFAPQEMWRPDHIALAEWADVYLVAPCTANVMAKLAHGLADDLLSCTALAFNGPLVIAPGMHDTMWAHPAVRANAACLLERGARLVDVDAGDLACGDRGKGRLADLGAILTETESALGLGAGPSVAARG